MRLLPRSLRGKLIALMLTSTVVCSAMLTGTGYYLSREIFYETALRNLGDATRLQASHVVASFVQIEKDAAQLVDAPTLRDIVEPVTARDFPSDAADARLAEALAALLRQRPEYARIRFVAVGSPARIVADVAWADSGVRVADHEPIEVSGLSGVVDDLLGGVIAGPVFSPLTMGDGSHRSGERAEIRFIHPVRDPDGKPVGALVIDALFQHIVHQARPLLVPGQTLLIVVPDGSFVHLARPDILDRLLAGPADAAWTRSALSVFSGAEGHEVTRLFRQMAVFGLRVPIGDGDSGNGLRFVSAIPQARLEREASRIFTQEFMLALMMVFLTALIAAVVGARLTAPLRRLTKVISASSGFARPLYPDIASQDEVGELARAFKTMGNTLIARSVHANAVFHGAGEGIVTIDETGKIMSINPAAEKIFGYSQREVLGQNLDMLMPERFRGRHPDYIATADRSGHRGRMASNRDVEGLRKNGEVFPLEVTVSHVGAGDQCGFVGILRDITDRKATDARLQTMLQELRDAKEDLRLSNSRLDDFVLVASHDLKSPLRVIESISSGLEAELDSMLTEDGRENIAILRGRVTRMRRLIDDLLAHSRIGECGDQAPVVSGIEVMEDVVALVAPPEGFRVEIGPGFREISIPRTPLVNILLNLVSNAIKHHDRDDGIVRVDVVRHEDHLSFSVVDDGPGIPVEHQERVFDMLSTLRPRDDVEGSGMGLAMVRKYVEMAGGSARVISKGRGCSFMFSWPRDDAEAEPVHGETGGTAQASP